VVVVEVVEVKIVEDEVEVVDAVEAGIEKVLVRSLGAGASKASWRGWLQSTTPFVVSQQFHCFVARSYTTSGRELLAAFHG
jgi:hypothetical protein